MIFYWLSLLALLFTLGFAAVGLYTDSSRMRAFAQVAVLYAGAVTCGFFCIACFLDPVGNRPTSYGGFKSLLLFSPLICAALLRLAYLRVKTYKVAKKLEDISLEGAMDLAREKQLHRRQQNIIDKLLWGTYWPKGSL